MMQPKIQKNKKGLMTFDFIIFIPRLLFLTIAFLTMLFLINMFIVDRVDVSKGESVVFVEGLMYSPNGISYNDGVRNHPGIVDTNKFTEETLNATFDFPRDKQPNLAAKLVLKKKDGSKISTIHYSRKWYDRWIQTAGRIGAGASTSLEINKHILYYDQNSNLLSGTLEIELVYPNS